MTSPCRTDPAAEVVDAAVAVMTELFRPGQVCPPKVGTTENVRVFAGDGAPLAAWDSHSSAGCDEPFIWVRSMRRYRSRQFPNPTIATDCELTRVLQLEVGVGWCAIVDDPDRRTPWTEYAAEALVSSDTAWRIEEGLCLLSKRLRRDDSERQVGTDTLTPYGPEGGVIAWTGVIYASYG